MFARLASLRAATYVLVVLLDTEDLGAELGGSLEARRGGDAVGEHEALAGLHVLIAEGAVLLLSGASH